METLADTHRDLAIEKTHCQNVKEYKIMTYRNILSLFCIILLTSCNFAVASSDTPKKNNQPNTTITETTDEIGEDIINVKSSRNEGYTVHPSNQIMKRIDAFYCKGFKVETLIVKREENQEVFSIDLTFKTNGEEVDLKPIIGSQSNLFGYYNLETDFSCVDDIIRVTVIGQIKTENNQLAPLANIIDFRIDRNTGYITSKKTN